MIGSPPRGFDPESFTFTAGPTTYSVVPTPGRAVVIDRDRALARVPAALWTAAGIAAAVAEAWRVEVAAYGEKLLAEWDEFAASIDRLNEHAGGEVQEDDADVFAGFERLRKMGVRFDPAFVADVEAVPRDWLLRGSESFIEDGSDGDSDDDDDREPEHEGPNLNAEEGGRVVRQDGRPAGRRVPAPVANLRRRAE